MEIAEPYDGVMELSEAHLHLIDFYNTITPLPRGYKVKYADAWCAVFVSVVMQRAGISDFPFECGCSEMFKQLRAKGCQIIGRPPIPGEIVFFTCSHVGIVNGWGDSNWNIPTIEGNSANRVAHRKHNVMDKTVLAWCSPYRYSRDEIQKQIDGNLWGVPGSNESNYLLRLNNYL